MLQAVQEIKKNKKLKETKKKKKIRPEMYRTRDSDSYNIILEKAEINVKKWQGYISWSTFFGNLIYN